MPFKALDAGQEAVSERGLILAVIREAVIDGKLAKPCPIDAAESRIHCGVVIVDDAVRFCL